MSPDIDKYAIGIKVTFDKESLLCVQSTAWFFFFFRFESRKGLSKVCISLNSGKDTQLTAPGHFKRENHIIKTIFKIVNLPFSNMHAAYLWNQLKNGKNVLLCWSLVQIFFFQECLIGASTMMYESIKGQEEKERQDSHPHFTFAVCQRSEKCVSLI